MTAMPNKSDKSDDDVYKKHFGLPLNLLSDYFDTIKDQLPFDIKIEVQKQIIAGKQPSGVLVCVYDVNLLDLGDFSVHFCDTFQQIGKYKKQAPAEEIRRAFSKTACEDYAFVHKLGDIVLLGDFGTFAETKDGINLLKSSSIKRIENIALKDKFDKGGAKEEKIDEKKEDVSAASAASAAGAASDAKQDDNAVQDDNGVPDDGAPDDGVPDDHADPPR